MWSVQLLSRSPSSIPSPDERGPRALCGGETNSASYPPCWAPSLPCGAPAPSSPGAGPPPPPLHRTWAVRGGAQRGSCSSEPPKAAVSSTCCWPRARLGRVQEPLGSTWAESGAAARAELRWAHSHGCHLLPSSSKAIPPFISCWGRRSPPDPKGNPLVLLALMNPQHRQRAGGAVRGAGSPAAQSQAERRRPRRSTRCSAHSAHACTGTAGTTAGGHRPLAHRPPAQSHPHSVKRKSHQHNMVLHIYSFFFFLVLKDNIDSFKYNLQAQHPTNSSDSTACALTLLPTGTSPVLAVQTAPVRGEEKK